MKICPECGGTMQQRQKKGPWFCDNYSALDPNSCQGRLPADHQESAFKSALNVLPIDAGPKTAFVACDMRGCDGIMVQRTGPYSTFYGCSNYPRCRCKMNLHKYEKLLNQARARVANE